MLCHTLSLKRANSFSSFVGKFLPLFWGLGGGALYGLMFCCL
jgi:hypothetical protein